MTDLRGVVSPGEQIAVTASIPGLPKEMLDNASDNFRTIIATTVSFCAQEGNFGKFKEFASENAEGNPELLKWLSDLESDFLVYILAMIANAPWQHSEENCAEVQHDRPLCFGRLPAEAIARRVLHLA